MDGENDMYYWTKGKGRKEGRLTFVGMLQTGRFMDWYDGNG